MKSHPQEQRSWLTQQQHILKTKSVSVLCLSRIGCHAQSFIDKKTKKTLLQSHFSETLHTHSADKPSALPVSFIINVRDVAAVLLKLPNWIDKIGSFLDMARTIALLEVDANFVVCP